MAILSIDELKILIEHPQNHCVSLYMPMQKVAQRFDKTQFVLKI